MISMENFKDMIKDIREIVEEACKSKNNKYTYTAWSHHIIFVVENAKKLAKKLGADEEIVEIAALLHDYASVLNSDWYSEHHVHSTKLAEELLKKYNYPGDRIERVKHCIHSHRGSRQIAKQTLEAEIVACADAMAHFDAVDSMFYLSFVILGKDLDEGTKYVLEKLERDWKKIMPEAKEMLKKKYDAIKLVLE